jgi:ankyrin repeat protein
MAKEKLNPEEFSQLYCDKFYNYIRVNNYKKVKSYLINGMNPDTPNKSGNYPLFAATIYYDMFKLLIDYKANYHIESNTVNLLHMACYNRCFDVVEYVVEKLNYSNVNELSKENKPPLYYALSGFQNEDKHQHLAKWLIEKGAKLELVLPHLNPTQISYYNIDKLLIYENTIKEHKLINNSLNHVVSQSKKLKV